MCVHIMVEDRGYILDWFSPSIVRIPGLNSGHQVWWQAFYLLNHLDSPEINLFILT